MQPLKYLIGDAVVVWRAWTMVPEAKCRIVLSILLLGSIGSTITMILEWLGVIIPQGTLYRIGRLLPLVLTNIVSTLMVGYRIWYSQKSLEAYVIEPYSLFSGMSNELRLTRNKIRRILLILIGSGLLYVVGWIYSVVTDIGLLNEDGRFLVEAFLPHISGLYFLVVSALVAFRKSQIDTYHTSA
ncbi:hypothetical protein K435DRAFT_810799 [Dendrothele bispora CBS 962.96]|uniref:Uncharacterized protein n=1 Tax=Dendrothele bispora (strain CBS 962.96) TaxID=1314807 RepID=A0A4S8KU37_DENBC|nr:hypothetical protein K435DRAFT_810799 [Dendrothele bispora CBS 962.96]